MSDRAIKGWFWFSLVAIVWNVAFNGVGNNIWFWVSLASLVIYSGLYIQMILVDLEKEAEDERRWM